MKFTEHIDLLYFLFENNAVDFFLFWDRAIS